MTSDEFSELLSKFLKGEEVPYKEAWLLGYHAACMDADVEASNYESEGARKVADALAAEFREVAGRYELTQCKPNDLQRENDELKKLCADMWIFGYSKRSGANSIKEWHTMRDALENRARKLGVNVD